MKKVIGGKTYVEVPEKIRDSCEGCYAWQSAKRDLNLCDALCFSNNDLNPNSIWEKQK